MGISKDRRTISGAEYRATTINYIQATAGVGQNNFLMAAPSKAVIEQVIIISDTASTASITAQHYEFQVNNLTQSEDLISTAVSTVTADIVADTPYILTPDQNNIVAQADVIEFQVSVAGTPTDFTSARITVQCNYRPI